MGVDLIVLVLTASGLLLSPGRSSLWHLLFRQGIMYFLAAFIGNMLPSVFIILNLNRTYFRPFLDLTTIAVIIKIKF